MNRFSQLAGLGLMAASISLSSAQASTPSDIPGSHWAKDEAKELVDKGYISLFGDNSFRGDAPLTRYAFLTAMSKLLDQLEAIRKGGGATGGGDTVELKALLGQVKSALGELETAQRSLGEKSEKTGATQEVLERDVTKLMDSTNQKLKRMESQLADLNSEMDSRDRRLRAELDAMNQKLRDAQKKNQQARTFLWLGVVAAAAVGVSGN